MSSREQTFAGAARVSRSDPELSFSGDSVQQLTAKKLRPVGRVLQHRRALVQETLEVIGLAMACLGLCCDIDHDYDEDLGVI